MKFRPIDYNPKYLISDTGVIVNSITNQTLTPYKEKNGYMRVNIINVFTKQYEKFLVHRLVAKAFCSNPNNYDIVNHKDEDKQNNNATNLEWCDVKYNHAYGNGMKKLSISLSIPITEVIDNKKIIYRSASIASKIINIGRQSINNVVNKKRNSVYGHKFRKATSEEIDILKDNDYIEVNITNIQD